jgi:hypothetical protein
MLKPYVIALAFAVALPATVSAQSTNPSGACKADYDKYCKGILPGGGRIVACLNEQHDKLSDACKTAIDSRKK